MQTGISANHMLLKQQKVLEQSLFNADLSGVVTQIQQLRWKHFVKLLKKRFV